jgi:hypothetical protein
MLTKWYNIVVSEEDAVLLSQMQQRYSYAFRKVYNNMDLTRDARFIEEIRVKHNISAKGYEYLVKECESFYERNKSTIERRKKQISELREKMDKEPIPSKRIKINKHIIDLTRSLSKGVVFGGKAVLQSIANGNDHKEEYKRNRLLPLCFYGETSRNGNRFFNFRGLSDGFVLFKPEGSDIKMNIELKIKKGDVLLLKQIEELAMKKECAVTVRLTTKRIYITYDEALLNGNKFDEKAVYKSISHIKDKDERRTLLRKAHVEFEEQMLAKKNKNRFLAVDMNPDGIGYSILEKKSDAPHGEFVVLKKEYLDFSVLNKQDTNKRKYEISIAIRYLFGQLSHYNCAYFVSEELNDLGGKDNGNRIANRKINNLWNREYINNLFTKYCNIRGIKRIEVNPAYSSFIGNINYETFDPIAASIEIGRRGIIKYIRGARIIPEFCMSNIANGLAEKISSAKKIYDNIYECKTWKELYKAFSTAKMSVRRKMDDFIFSGTYLENEKSTVKKLCFL